MIIVRRAVPADLKRITEIFNYYIRNSSANFMENELTIEEMEAKYKSIIEDYVFLVAEEKENGIVGLAYSSAFRSASAYRIAETTIYLAPEQLNRGLGKDLYYELIIQTARKKPNLTGLIAVITTDNAGSIRFHEKMNFQKVGHIKDAGCKFDTFYDIGIWQYPINQ